MSFGRSPLSQGDIMGSPQIGISLWSTPDAKEGEVLQNSKGDLATVEHVTDTMAGLNYNHPLAGKPLNQCAIESTESGESVSSYTTCGLSTYYNPYLSIKGVPQ